MNKERRKKIEDTVYLLEKHKTAIKELIKDIKETKNELQDVLMDEEFAFDNMPENLQYSMRGEESQNAIDIMNDAVSDLEDIIDSLNEIC